MKNVLELQKTPELKTLDDYRSVALKLSERSSIVPYVPLDILYPITAIEINREVESRKKKCAHTLPKVLKVLERSPSLL